MLAGHALAEGMQRSRLEEVCEAPGVVAHESWFSQDPEARADMDALYEEEAVLVAASVESRRREFAAGRICARRALAELGIQDFPLLAGPDRAPRWPGAVVGSITHTTVAGEGYCAVAVAHRRTLTSVGIDAEPSSPLPSDLWQRVLDAREQRDALASPAPGVWARLLFSAKEAVYKAVYPLCGRFLDFFDVHIELDAQPGRLRAELVGPARSLAPAPFLPVRFAADDALLLTAVLIAASGSPLAAPNQGLSGGAVPC